MRVMPHTRLQNSWPVVLANRLKVVTYSGSISLSTKSASFFMLNPDIPEAISLCSWSTEQKENIENIILTTPPPKQTKRTSPTKNTIIDIATANHTQPKETLWIKATASITNFKQNFWYVGCSKCHKTIYVDCGKIYNCLLCHQRNVTDEPRCRFAVELRDTTGTLKVVCLGHNAEKLFPITATQLKAKTNGAGVTVADYLASIGTTTCQLLSLKPYENQGAGKGQRAPTIIAIGNENAESEVAQSSKRSSA